MKRFLIRAVLLLFHFDYALGVDLNSLWYLFYHTRLLFTPGEEVALAVARGSGSLARSGYYDRNLTTLFSFAVRFTFVLCLCDRNAIPLIEVVPLSE